jgi:hypothetical protein
VGSVLSIKISEVSLLAHLRESVESNSISLDQGGLSDDVWQIVDSVTGKIIYKLKSNSIQLQDVVKKPIFLGIIIITL